MSTGSAIWLLGRDYTELGPVGVVSHPLGGTLALSRGLFPKRYAHVDPNEDGALLLHSDAGTLLAVTDGHNGAQASERALEAVRGAGPRLLVEDPTRFEAEVAGLVVGLSHELRQVHPSRTCLVLITVLGRTCHVASFGDSSAFRASEARELVPRNPLVLGPDLAKQPLGGSSFAAHFERAPGERVAVVSDGITDFLPELTQLRDALKNAPDDRAAASQIVRQALLGRAGDNVAVAAFSGPP